MWQLNSQSVPFIRLHAIVEITEIDAIRVIHTCDNELLDYLGELNEIAGH